MLTQLPVHFSIDSSLHSSSLRQPRMQLSEGGRGSLEGSLDGAAAIVVATNAAAVDADAGNGIAVGATDSATGSVLAATADEDVAASPPAVASRPRRQATTAQHTTRTWASRATMRAILGCRRRVTRA
jgi:hypothetical protein